MKERLEELILELKSKISYKYVFTSKEEYDNHQGAMDALRDVVWELESIVTL